MAPTIRRAFGADLEGIVRVYMADDRGGHGDAWSEEARPDYERAMTAILMSPVNRLFVVEMEGAVIGTFQLTLTPGLVGRGRTRATLESVHVLPDFRGQGIGARMVAHAVAEARAAGAGVIQLSSNKTRTDAHRLYERLGFSRSHEGFKLAL